MAVRIDILPSRYTDVEHIARGGMGDVYRATDTVLGRTVAVKLLAERYAGDEDVKRRFKNEALAAARLSGAPSTVTIFDVGETDGQAFIVMEFLEGGSLEQRLRTGRPDTADVLRWLEQTAAALDAGHAAGVIHRDVKPGNLLLDGHGQVHVADFGVASAAGLDSLTVTGMVLGTSGYLSPEQARGERATPASDRYALGVVAWELLTGRRPYESDSPTAEAAAHANAPVPSLSPELDPVFKRALAKDPAHRYPTAGAFVADLRRALEPRPVPETARPRSVVIPALLLLALGLLGGGLALAGVFGGEEEPARTVVQRETVTTEGETVTTNVTVTTQPEPPPPPPPPAAGKSGVQLTDEATALLGVGRWAEAEVVARQAVGKLKGSGELYEAYAEYDLGRALAEQGKCPEALRHLNRSEQLQGHRSQIDDARSKCQ
ncbi:MAG TPA: serine/threonine-protein kinase [Gaiellaceae bacterium]|jgi:serine/threonine protein kinase|nr:serine/threonine-protein kinase [Gaiellaceae bacterium]